MKRRRKRGNKKDAQTKHFKKRLQERSSISNFEDFKNKALSQIKQGKSRFVQRQSLRVSVHGVRYEDDEVFVVYDKERTTLVTVLEPEWVNNDTIKEQ